MNIQTLRYYERRGLVVAGYRRHSGQREFDEADIRKVQVIKAAQRLGFTLAEIQEMFDLSAHRRGHRRTARAGASQDRRDRRADRHVAGDARRPDGGVDAECDSLTDCSCGLGCPLPFVELSDVRD